MAKTIKPVNKQTISTKAIFSKGKANKVSKTSKHVKAKQVPEHELSKAFSESINLSRDHIYEAAVTNYEAAYKGLSQRLTEIDDQCTKGHQALVESAKHLDLSFKNEEIEFRSEDGKTTGAVVLNNRMKKLQKTVDAEERELIRQWEEWLEVEAEIDSLAAEFIAQNMPVQVAGETNQPGNLLTADQVEMMEEIEAEKARFTQLMEQAAKASIKEMKDSEKELKLEQKRTADDFTALLQDEEY